jgi:hypothetical protein
MFNGASSFNQPIGNWDGQECDESMRAMFKLESASSFNQSLANWDGRV